MNKFAYVLIALLIISIVINMAPVVSDWTPRGGEAIVIYRNGEIKPSDAPIKYVNGRYVVMDNILGAVIYIYRDNTILDINGHFLKISGSPLIYIEKAHNVVVTNGVVKGKGLAAISIVNSSNVSINDIIFIDNSNIQFIVDNSRNVVFENLSVIGEFGSYGKKVFDVKFSENIILKNLYLPLNTMTDYGATFSESSNIKIQNVTLGPTKYDLVFARSKNAEVNRFNAGNSHVGLELYKSENITINEMNGGMLYVIDSKNIRVNSSKYTFMKMKKGRAISIEDTLFSNEQSWRESTMESTTGLTLRNIVFNYKVWVKDSIDIYMYNISTSIVEFEDSQMIRVDHIYFSLWKENEEIDYMSLAIINSSDIIISNITYGVLEVEPNTMTQSSLIIKDSCGITISYSDLSRFRDFRIENSSGNTFVLNIMPGPPEIDPPNKKNYWNTTVGNYWPDYQGVDEDGDGIGDAPYKINDVNIDYRPLMMKNITYYIKYLRQTITHSPNEITTSSPSKTTLTTKETASSNKETTTLNKSSSMTTQTNLSNMLQNKAIVIVIAIILLLIIALLAKKK